LLDKLGEEAYHYHIAEIKESIKNTTPILKLKNSDSHASYTGDIYSKGAYFMHSLRYSLGDSIFFKTLYQFANDSNYTYNNLVETNDLLKLVNSNSGKDYSPFFNLFLKTTDLPDVQIDSLGNNKWNVTIPNINFELPMGIDVDGEIVKSILSSESITIEASSRIKVDPIGWFLHKKDFKKK